MKPKTLVILAVVLALLAGIAYISRTNRPDTMSADIGSLILKGLDVNEVAGIKLVRAGESINVGKVDGVWVSVDRYNYPVQFDKVREFLKRLSEMTVGQSIAATEGQRSKLQLKVPPADGLGDPREIGTVVTLTDAEGKETASVLIGMNHMSKPINDAGSSRTRAMGTRPDGRYVAVDGNVYLVSEILSVMPAMITEWLKTDIVSVYSGDIAEVTVTGLDRDPIKLIRPEGGGDMVLVDIKRKQEADPTSVNGLANALSFLKFDDIADPALDDKQLGMTDPVICRFSAKDGMIYTVRVGGSPEGDDRVYLRVAASFNETAEAKPVEDDKPADAEASLAERAALLNELASGWTFIVRDYTAKTFLAAKADLIKKDED